MKSINLSIICIFIIFSCGNKKDESKSFIITDKTITTNDSSTFRYKNLMLDTNNQDDTIQPKKLKELFGVWTINSIAEVGGTMANEQLVQSQVGHELLINDSILSLPFLNQDIKILRPKYSLVKRSDNNKCTSLFHGYKVLRNSVTSLKAHESYFFEIVNSHELAYYYDGRIYFFKRKK